MTSVVFGDVTSMAKRDFFGDVTANLYLKHLASRSPPGEEEEAEAE